MSSSVVRENLVSELVKSVLGPRDGPTEEIRTDPAFEYVTGILAPVSTKPRDPEYSSPHEEEAFSTREDDHYDKDAGEIHPTNPALDPKSIPSTMGLSFFVKSTDPRFKVCVTWGRYVAGEEKWTRKPYYDIINVGGYETYKRQLGSGETPNRLVFRYEASTDTTTPDTARISMFLENEIGGRVKGRTETYVFQPQIRVVCLDGSIVPGFKTVSPSSADAEASLVYRNRPFLAKGHLTSALWRDVDPEREHGIAGNLDPVALSSPPFHWVDGKRVPAADRDEFSPPDARTEYVPICSVPTPGLTWHDADNTPELDAATLANTYNPDRLCESIQPIVSGYKKWISCLEKDVHGCEDEQRDAGEKMVRDCKNVCRRITSGIKMLRHNDDARLAFCFANEAVARQHYWKSKEKLRYHPFQLAFILATLESVINKRSEDREVCDLLWVPTGAGKTEAYLAVVAMVLAYRRLRHSDGGSGAGVSVITRYTLRLLTIQQFRRTLSVILAAEYLRVHGLGSEKPTGWRPDGCARNDDHLWGSEPFSAGLWVGESLTPNGLMKTKWSLGAIKLLQDLPRDTEAEPAQITECPACKGILAVPKDGLKTGRNSIHFVVSSDSSLKGQLQAPDTGGAGFTVDDIRGTPHKEKSYFTLTVRMTSKSAATHPDVDRLWNIVKRSLEAGGSRIEPCFSNAARPGYFIRDYTGRGGKRSGYDFDILCPNPDCQLKVRWKGGSPQGKIHGRQPDADGDELPGGMVAEDVITPFRSGSMCVSDRIPIKAFTVDEQVYREAPSVVVATVDKFARLPFKPEAGSMFGNVSFHHPRGGYSRDSLGKGSAKIRPLDRPDMIIQDELHLIDGPLGSMVGAYEAAVDFLSGTKWRVKYIASTATISNPETHVKSVLDRDLMLFPPAGIDGDRFFVRDKERHQLDDAEPGRLYAGICCPGRGPITPLVRIWASLLQTVHDCRRIYPDSEVDRFWTLAGYFNSIRELGGARALYRQDIPERINAISKDPRSLDFDSSAELSSRTDSARLPSILASLNRDSLKSPDGLFTTSMFGTGVDIPRIGLMLVNGQPKTTTSYIQSTGRVGRSAGALVVTFFRASRPRDLNHYEFFFRHHLQLQRFVEPVTAYPFASGILDGALGPVALGILRNMITRNPAWRSDNGAAITGAREADEIGRINEYLEKRASRQPEERKPEDCRVRNHLESGWDRWKSKADEERDIVFKDYTGSRDAVVLGGQHDDWKVVFKNVPRSLRELEDELSFEA